MSNNERKKYGFIDDEMILCNNPQSGMPKVFNDDEEHCYHGKFYDGIAVLKADPDDYGVPEKLIMTYPTMEIVNSDAAIAREIREYAGLDETDGINYYHVALKYGNPYILSDIELPF